MLGIIFTREKMFAGMIRGREIHWLSFENNQNCITHQGNYLDVLKLHLDQLLLTYQWSAPAAYGMTLQESLTIAIVFPADSFFVSAREKNDLIAWVLADPSRCASLQIDHAANLIFEHFNLPTKNLPTILFDAFDGDTLISTNFENDFSNDLPRLLPSLGKNEGIGKIFNVFLKDFERKNIVLNQEQKAHLEQQVTSFFKDKKLEINVLENNVEIITRLKLSESRYYDLLTSQRNIIKNIFLLYKNFDIYKISIIFVSDFFDNGIFRDFMGHFIEKEVKINAHLNFISDEAFLELLLRLMFKKSKSVAVQTPITEKTKLRKSFFNEIAKKCTDRKKYSDYTAKFLPKGRAINVSDDVTIWHIRNALYNPQSLENIGRVIQKKQSVFQENFAPITQKSDVSQPPFAHTTKRLIEKNQTATTIIVENNSTKIDNDFSQSITNTTQKKSSAHDRTSDADMTTVVALSHLFVIQKWNATQAFLQFDGRLKSANENMTVRVLKKEHSASENLDFRLLHEREFSYYKDVSSLLEADFGWYYTRPFIDGESLESYIKRTGISQKYSLNELSSNDLELVLAIFKEVKSLTFRCPLGKENFLVQTRRKLNLTKIVEVKIININTKNIDLSESEKQINSMLETLLGHNLYHEFIYHIQNQHP
jgi:hypothetical protein